MDIDTQETMIDEDVYEGRDGGSKMIVSFHIYITSNSISVKNSKEEMLKPELSKRSI